MNIAIVGIQGLPNSYGGFETLAEQLVAHLGEDLSITVYCSSKDMPGKPSRYMNSRLKYIPVSSHGAAGIIYDSLSLLSAVRRNDKILILGFGAGFAIPFLRRHKAKIIVNIGGLDWKRNKWNRFAQRMIKLSEGWLLKFSGRIISDNIGIQKYIKDQYKRESSLIAYGGDQANYQPITPASVQEYPFLAGDYAFTVARIQQDNNIELLIKAFSRQDDLKLVIVGNWEASEYGKALKKSYQHEKMVILLDAIYQRDILDILRSNCTIYIHGHSAGGTNPSLVEAMHLGLPVFALASGYNEYTSHEKALYFKDMDELVALVRNRGQYDLRQMGIELKAIAKREYVWKDISQKYKEIILSGS